ncbi:transketolase C-terminal domain-containing protein, partial [Methylobacter sp.]|uniref:transketolase C-terminal domain-containing protein n=1 Tax=Methylobacter sp. TaxID=2051955 RepID=UPI003DA48DAA
TALPIGQGEVRHQGSRIAILAWGSLVAPALAAGKHLGATVVNMRFVKPIDTDLILELAKSHDVFVTAEENVLAGGAGSAVNDFLQAQKILMPVLNIGLPDQFVEQGTREELLALCGLDAQGLIRRIETFCA